MENILSCESNAQVEKKNSLHAHSNCAEQALSTFGSCKNSGRIEKLGLVDENSDFQISVNIVLFGSVKVLFGLVRIVAIPNSSYSRNSHYSCATKRGL